MANYHFEASIIKRSIGQSIVDRTAYIWKEKLRDSYTGRIYDRRTGAVQKPISGIRLPDGAPSKLYNAQEFLDALNASEKRCDAQMARSYILSLPNELTLEQQLELAMTFIDVNFTKIGYGSIYAIHLNAANDRGRESIPAREGEIKANPHLHLIVPFRLIDGNGFQPTKLMSRTTNSREYLIRLRRAWADDQNRFYERLGLNIRVSHESLDMQGLCKHRVPHLSPAEFALERKGEKTRNGDRLREAVKKNERLFHGRSHERTRGLEREPGPSR